MVALHRIKTAYRPSPRAAHRVHFTYLSFPVFMNLSLQFTVRSILTFLEYLFTNHISCRLILNYISSLKSVTRTYHWDITPLSNPLVLSYLRVVRINSTFAPTPRGVFHINIHIPFGLFCMSYESYSAVNGYQTNTLHAPLFAHRNPPHYPLIDTTIRDALKTVLTHMQIPIRGHGFYSFCSSGATLVFDNNIQLQHIMARGLWRCSEVWHYLQNASVAPSIIPLTFSKVIPSHF